MPYKWVDPELFLEHKGVMIWCTYDQYWDDRNDYWYTTQSAYDDTEGDMGCGYGEDGRDYIFDVRELPTYVPILNNFYGEMSAAIKKAIDLGIITQEGYRKVQAPQRAEVP